MTAYRFGDIVLIGFPHTDLHGVSKRPAIVMYDSGDQDILVARVTAQLYATDADYDWHRCGLPAESFVGLGKLATVQKRYVIRQLGALETGEIDELKSKLRKMFSL
ncbi:MAG: type II toxin-antitoxin system PemK/MazF family toxin [Syntrophobacteraceae bacterium]